jgi:hypothetical protein
MPAKAWGPISVNDNPGLIGENDRRKRFYNGLIDDVRVTITA